VKSKEFYYSEAIKLSLFYLPSNTPIMKALMSIYKFNAIVFPIIKEYTMKEREISIIKGNSYYDDNNTFTYYKDNEAEEIYKSELTTERKRYTPISFYSKSKNCNKKINKRGITLDSLNSSKPLIKSAIISATPASKHKFFVSPFLQKKSNDAKKSEKEIKINKLMANITFNNMNSKNTKDSYRQNRLINGNSKNSVNKFPSQIIMITPNYLSNCKTPKDNKLPLPLPLNKEINEENDVTNFDDEVINVDINSTPENQKVISKNPSPDKSLKINYSCTSQSTTLQVKSTNTSGTLSNYFDLKEKKNLKINTESSPNQEKQTTKKSNESLFK